MTMTKKSKKTTKTPPRRSSCAKVWRDVPGKFRSLVIRELRECMSRAKHNSWYFEDFNKKESRFYDQEAKAISLAIVMLKQL